jgi:uncharacterized repeat protein (TIGR01451 family)
MEPPAKEKPVATVDKPAKPHAAPQAPGTVVAYFPTGKLEGSSLSLEKSAPSEAISGQPFEYTYKVSNLTDLTLENVKVSDRASGNFSPGDSNPKPSSTADGVSTWNLGALAPKASQTISVSGTVADEGTLTTCGWATFTPVACQEIRITKANISLTMTSPAEALICDPLPVVLAVKNAGTSPLTAVQITATLPFGMTSGGKGTLTFDGGILAPGETKEMKYNVTAANTGKFLNSASVTSAEGVSAKATAQTVIHQALLSLSCKAPEQQFMGRKFDVCYTISNKGDAPASGTTINLAVPAGLVPTTTTANGQVKKGGVLWSIGSLAAGESKEVCATFMSTNSGSYTFAATGRGSCGAPVMAGRDVKVVGISAILLEKSDDPDPIAVGDTTTYTVKVTNQGSADDSNVQVIVKLAPELQPVSTSQGTISGQVVTLPLVAKLGSKQSVSYKIVAKGVKAGDAHTKFTLSSDVLKSSISAEESTTVY